MVIEQGGGGEIEHPYERETFKQLIDPGGGDPSRVGLPEDRKSVV